MRGAIFSFVLLSACASTDDNFIGVGEGPDATGGGRFGVDASKPPVLLDAAEEDGPRFNGGATFACHGCTCDGTLYGCLQNANPDGKCPQGGGPPPDHMPIADAAALDDGGTCEAGIVCRQLPVECLPDPTCDCIMQSSGFQCAVDPSGNGFILTCPSPPP